jgi:hypothetical protein
MWKDIKLIYLLYTVYVNVKSMNNISLVKTKKIIYFLMSKLISFRTLFCRLMS